MERLEDISERYHAYDQELMDPSHTSTVRLMFLASKSAQDIPYLVNALRAVQEIHKPVRRQRSTFSPLEWDECLGDHSRPTEWPCPEVQAIKDALPPVG